MNPLKKSLLNVAYTLARTSLGSWFLRWVIKTRSEIIPVNRLRETKTLLAFFHPNPSYPFHVLLIPKRSMKGIADLQEADNVFLRELFQAVDSLVSEYGLDRGGYRLLVNGGSYQDIELLHFHLISEFGL